MSNRTCARIGCGVQLGRANQRWCSDACRKAAARDPLQGRIPKNWPARSRRFWEGMARLGLGGRRSIV